MSAFRLSDVAPRLALARDQWVVAEVARRAAERATAREEARLATARLRAERLVAHRELQALRAATTGNVKYIRYRHRKLERAQADRRRLG